jgi:2-polyprenyl-6-methoxyphenol hydroxylase-like FAD-dependent oxidoreductase
MTLARSLAQFGVCCMMVERQPSTTRHPKMDISNGRSIELFRRLGLVDGLRATHVAWRGDHCDDGGAAWRLVLQ